MAEFYAYKEWENKGDGYQWNYNLESFEDEDRVTWESLQPLKNLESAKTWAQNNKCDVYVKIPYSAWGDYVGDTVNRANYESLFEDHKRDSRFLFQRGGYLFHDAYVLFSAWESDEEIKDIFARLNNYPLLSEDKLSQIEFTLESESWDSWVKYDLPRALNNEGIEFTEDTLKNDFYYMIRYNEISGYCEDAVSWNIDLNKVVEKWDFHYCPSCNERLKYKGENCQNCPPLFDITEHKGKIKLMDV